MATNTKQLLNNQELCKKLGGSSSAKTVLNAGEILSNWNNVYLVGNLTGKVVPNNGEVRPVFNLKYGSTPLNAYNNNSTTAINVKDDSWDSSSAFSINTSCYFYNSSNNVASSGSYMESTATGNGYTYYTVNSSGKVTESGIYYPHYFSWTNQIVTVDKNSTNVNAPYSTNESSITVAAKRKFNIAGNSNTADNNLIATVDSANSQIKLSRDQIDSSKPITFVQVTGTHYGTLFKHGLLVVPPWNISASNISNISYLGETKTPSITTNTGNYTLTKASSSDTWYTINNNNTITINGNTTHYDRSATINVTESISGTYTYDSESISYSSGNISTSFTITQNKTPDINLYVVWFPQRDITHFYVVKTNNPDYDNLTPDLYAAPQRIGIAPITIHFGLNGRQYSENDYVEYELLGQFIQSNNSSISLSWAQETNSSNSPIYYVNSEVRIGAIQLSNGSNFGIVDPSSGSVSVSWGGSAPAGYNLHNTLIIK